MATAQTLIDRALRLCGALASGESPSAQETADSLIALNSMVDSWQTDRLAIYAVQDVTKTLTVSDGSYTIGSSGDINTTRPVKIVSAYITENGSDYPLEIIDQRAYDGLTAKTVTSSLPEYLYYAPAYPIGTIKLWPVPSAANVLTLQVWTPVQSFATAGTSVSLPPGYERALTTNLAIELAPEFGKAISQEVAKAAQESKAAIKRMNIRPIYLQNEMAMSRRYSIEADA